jgi:hypothetical protein
MGSELEGQERHPAPETPAYALYSPWQVGGATFLGSFAAGCVLMARNYRRLGMLKAATRTWYSGLAATAAVLVVAFLLPDQFPRSPIGVACTVAMFQIAKQQQGRTFAEHTARGGRKASVWSVIGIGLLSAFAILALLFLICLLLPDSWM